jgi:hypothetical protein
MFCQGGAPQSTAAGQMDKEMWHIYTMKHYSLIKRMSFARKG